MRIEALRTAVTRGLAPGQFRSLGSRRHAVLPLAWMPTAALRDVFVQRDLARAADGRERLQVVLAEQRALQAGPDSGS